MLNSVRHDSNRQRQPVNSGSAFQFFWSQTWAVETRSGCWETRAQRRTKVNVENLPYRLPSFSSPSYFGTFTGVRRGDSDALVVAGASYGRFPARPGSAFR